MQNWKKERLRYNDTAKTILKKLILEEKISLLSGDALQEDVRNSIRKKGCVHYNESPYHAGGLEEKGIPGLYFVDGTRGVVCGQGENTCFPVSVMRGATFNPELEECIGESMAEETLACGGTLFGGICVNLPYHPGWGRSQESYGEDSCLLGEMGAALIRGVRKHGVMACVKHFAFNSMENARFHVSVSCDKRTEREVFLPHFKKCIDAGADAVMTAYNSYEGISCGHHDYLLNQVLKGEWDFDGFVMSDLIWGIRDTSDAMNGGLDMEMPVTKYYGENLVKAVKKGNVSTDRIEEAALRIIRTLLASEDRRNRNVVRKPNRSGHSSLALRCAREGITLLKNENEILPVNKKYKKRIAVLGELAERENIGDHGSSQVYPPYVITPLQGIVRMAQGTEILYYTGESTQHCRRLAREADLVIVIAGNDYHDEGEHIAADSEEKMFQQMGGDRVRGLGLNERDRRIIETVGDVRTDAVVVLICGGMITVNDWEDKAGAILLAYYPGMEGGTALGEVLFGKVNPGGKLPFVIPEKEKDLPAIDWNASQIVYGYYHGYTLLQKTGKNALYPFGFGLSYTRFQICDPKAWLENGRICASVSVQNTGSRAGDEVIQMYVGIPDSCVERPEYVLKSFRRVHIPKKKRITVTLYCNADDMAYYDEDTNTFITEDAGWLVYIGNSSARKDLYEVEIERTSEIYKNGR